MTGIHYDMKNHYYDVLIKTRGIAPFIAPYEGIFGTTFIAPFIAPFQAQDVLI